MEKCKGCGKEINPEESKKVGDWLFCPACFQNLLTSSQKPSSKEAEPKKDKTEPKKGDAEPKKDKTEPKKGDAEPKKDDAKPGLAASISIRPQTPECHICGDKIKDKDYKKLGDWVICKRCSQELMPPVQPEKKEEEEEVEEEQSVEQVTIYPGTPSGRYCQGCGRGLVEGGYYEANGFFFCPNCYYTLLETVKKTQEVQQLSAAALTPQAASTAQKCESCLRELPKEAFQLVEGFLICRACCMTDMESALKIARSRHKKLMELRSKELGD